MLALYLQTQYQQSPRLLSPGSGNVSARYVGWNSTGMANGGTGGFTNSSQIPGVGGGRFNKCEDTDSGTGSSSEAHVIRHIDRNILACQICQQRYKEPKVLPCLHTFCLGCLGAYLPPESLTITCPLCGQQSILPQKGIKALQPNHFISHLIEVLAEDTVSIRGCDNTIATTATNDTGCYSCTISTYDSEEEELSKDPASLSYNNTNSHSECYNTRSDSPSPTSGPNCGSGDYDSNRELSCHNHLGQTLKFYCEDCETAICASCTDIGHRDHFTKRMAEAVESEKVELRSLVDGAYVQMTPLKEGISNVNEMSKTLNELNQKLEKEINDAFDELVKMMNDRRNELLNRLGHISRCKQATLAKQKDELEGSLADLYTSCEFVEKALTHGSETEILLVKKQVEERLQEYGKMQVVKTPAENSYLIFDKGEESILQRITSTWGEMFGSSALHTQTTALGEGIKSCTVGRGTIVTITTRDWQGDVTLGPTVENFLCELVPLQLSQGASGHPFQLTTELTDLEDGTYELKYSLPMEGQYELSIKLFGHHISGSPFKVAAVADTSEAYERPHPRSQRSSTVRHRSAKRPSSSRSFVDSACSRNNPIEDDLVLKVGNRGRNRGEFTNPQGVAMSPDGLIVVTDSNNQCVQCFDSVTGCVRLRFGARGRGPGQLQRPTGVALMQNGNLAIADYDNKCVTVFEPSGKYVNRIGVGKLLGPKGIAVNRSGHLVVVDNRASCILVFQPNGKLVQKFGSRGSEPNKFAGPHFVAIDSQDHIIISDFHNHSIKVFDHNGEFLFCFGSNGEGNGQFNAPTGLAVDAQDNILVADWGNSRIQIFDSQGSFLSFVNTVVCPLYGPQGLALTHDGHIVVADSGNHCFKLYKYLQ